MFGVSPFGSDPFGSAAGIPDTGLSSYASASDELSVIVTTQIALAASASALDTMSSSPPITAFTLYAAPKFEDTFKCNYGHFFLTSATILDSCAVSGITTGITFASNAISEDQVTVDDVLTGVQLGTAATVSDAFSAGFYICSHCGVEDSLAVVVTSAIQLNTEAIVTDALSTESVTLGRPLMSSAVCSDSLQIQGMSAVVTTYPGHDKYVFEADARDYENVSEVRDYTLDAPDRDYINLLPTKDYEIFYYYTAGEEMTAKTLSTKDPGETIPVKFHFDNLVSTIDTADALDVSLNIGEVDPDMAAMLEGSPVVDGSLVVQMVKAGLSGNEYKLRCTIRSGGEVYIGASILPVETE